MEANNTPCKDVRPTCRSCRYCMKVGNGSVCIYNPPKLPVFKSDLLDCGRHPAVYANEFCHHFKSREAEVRDDR